MNPIVVFVSLSSPNFQPLQASESEGWHPQHSMKFSVFIACTYKVEHWLCQLNKALPELAENETA